MSAAVRARQIAVPVEVRALGTLPDPDYAYACAIARAPQGTRSAEWWARSVFEGAPAAVRSFLRFGWVLGLGLRLGPRASASHVFGWKIISSNPETIMLGIESRLLSAQLVVHVDGTRVIHATFLRYRRRAARIVWAVARPIHQLVIPWLMRIAARR